MKPLRIYVDTSVIGARSDAIASWNFRHIVRLDKMKAHDQVNLLHGYGVLTIVSPKEVYIDEPGQDEKDV